MRPTRSMPPVALAVSGLLWLVACGGAAAALEVQDAVWGFDGRAVPQRINLLSVLVVNGTEQPYDGMVSLEKRLPMGERVGASITQPCFLAPFTSRWVQFYPYASEENEQWSVLTRGSRHKLPAARLGPPACVYLTNPDAPGARVAEMKSFPKSLFPVTVAATDGLHALVLDHTPQWEPARRTAFLDWLRRGGELHILRDQTGAWPEFRGEMAPLNNANKTFHLGAGTVFRHDRPAAQTTNALIAATGSPRPALEESQNFMAVNLEESLFRELRGLTRPEHQWGFIYLILCLYILIMGPINYVVAKVKSRDFRYPFFLFVGTVAAFGLALTALGRRGYGEKTATYAVTYARAVDEGVYDATQWVNVFVTRGGHYTIRYPGEANIFSTCENAESVRGRISCGREASFQADIPLYSSRSFLHRARMEGPALGAKVVQWSAGGELNALTVATGPDFPPHTIEAWALYGDKVYRLRRDKDALRVMERAGQGWDNFFAEHNMALCTPGFGAYGYRSSGGAPDPEAACKKALRPLMARALGGTEMTHYYCSVAARPTDRVHLFVFAREPSHFRMSSTSFGAETVYVLYHAELLKPE